MSEHNKPQSSKKHHKVRSFFSSIFGIAAIWLLMMSIIVIWLNRTLISTPTYVSTVGPIVLKADVQNLIANKVTTQLLKSAPINDMASSLLPANDLNQDFSTNQLKALLQPMIENDIISILKSTHFANLWTNTNEMVHSELVSQLNGNSTTLSLNFNPAINGIVSELQATQLKAVASHISISANTGNLVVRGSKVSKIRSYYKMFQLGTLAFVALAIISFGLAVWIAVNHWKTVKRLLLIGGIFAFAGALILESAQWIPFGGQDQLTVKAIRAIFSSIVHYLFISDIIIGVVFVGAVFVINFFLHRGSKKQKSIKSGGVEESEETSTTQFVA
jgi:flagellar basal body-associated protein FliL